MGGRTLKERVFQAVDRRPEEVVSLCCDLVRIPSENPPGDTTDVTAFVTRWLEERGFSYEVLGPTETCQSVLVTLGRAAGKTLILSGHLDVVPAGSPGKWRVDPFGGVVKDGYVWGRGASDMKGGVAGLLSAVAILQEACPHLPGTLTLALVPDEETGGVQGSKWLLDHGKLHGQACIIGEPSLIRNCTIGQKGAVWLKAAISGTPAHGSLAPWVGDNAILKAAAFAGRVLALAQQETQVPESVESTMRLSRAFMRELVGEKGADRALQSVSVNVGILRGGSKVNIVPDYAEMEMDLRVPIGMRAADVAAELRRIAAGFEGVALDFLWESEPNYTLPDEAIVNIVRQNVRAVTGCDLTPTFQWASSDARFFRQAGIPTLQYGPAELGGIHACDERVRVDDLVAATKVYLGCIADFFGLG